MEQWVKVALRCRCLNLKTGNVTARGLMSYKNWIGSDYNKYSVIISLPV